ncbi:hypothetical protein XENORESO_018519 [Xenotaenia resolanae]|uniref:Uncharacterized protein n=1 Tax=Xenotaenia resolanae TaxID=208358 RepID=A0ABV0WTI5_9TELE
MVPQSTNAVGVNVDELHVSDFYSEKNVKTMFHYAHLCVGLSHKTPILLHVFCGNMTKVESIFVQSIVPSGKKQSPAAKHASSHLH